MPKFLHLITKFSCQVPAHINKEPHARTYNQSRRQERRHKNYREILWWGQVERIMGRLRRYRCLYELFSSQPNNHFLRLKKWALTVYLCQVPVLGTPYYFFFFTFFNVYSFLTDRDRVWAGEEQRKKGTQNPKQALGIITEPSAGLEPTNHEIMAWAKV